MSTFLSWMTGREKRIERLLMTRPTKETLMLQMLSEKTNRKRRYENG